MTKISLAVVSAALAIGMAAPASAATTDPEVIIYRVAGVHDSGGAANTGVATSFHCTNFSGATEFIRIVVRDNGAAIKANVGATIDHLKSQIFSTHNTNLFGDADIGAGFVNAGTAAAIAATSINVVCTAMLLDASAGIPVGIACTPSALIPLRAARNRRARKLRGAA